MIDASSAIPADDPNRTLTVADPDSPGVRHVCRGRHLQHSRFRR